MNKIFTYLANGLGFSETGRILLHDYIVPKIRIIDLEGLEVVEPFLECAKRINFSRAEDFPLYEERVNFWKKVNEQLPKMNKNFMKDCQMMSPVLDGGHSVDDGVANEIGHYAVEKYGPIIALRTDVRMAENIGAIVNPQIEDDIYESGGKICRTMKEWFQEVENTYRQLKRGFYIS
jgi:hypothetical protein